MRKTITVTYHSSCHAACGGTLTVKQGGAVVYQEEGRLRVLDGGIEYDAGGYAHARVGRLAWLDAADFAKDIQIAVTKRLSTVEVCCGGCA